MTHFSPRRAGQSTPAGAMRSGRVESLGIARLAHLDYRVHKVKGGVSFEYVTLWPRRKGCFHELRFSILGQE
jgi:hypothetical protein